MKKLSHVGLIFVFLLVLQISVDPWAKASAAPTFNYAYMFSQVSLMDPVYWPGSSPSSWRMMTFAELDYAVEPGVADPVTVSSTPTGSYELDNWNAFGANDHFNIGIFLTFNHPDWGGPFPAPGPTWEDQTYTFTADTASVDYYIPTGSLRQLDIPQVTVIGGYYPTISWEPVEHADYYMVLITPLREVTASLPGRSCFHPGQSMEPRIPIRAIFSRMVMNTVFMSMHGKLTRLHPAALIPCPA